MSAVAGMLTGLLGMLAGDASNSAVSEYLSVAGTIHGVEPKPVPYPMMVNDALVSLPAWHVKGSFAQAGKFIDVDWYLLDDPANAVTLR